MSSKYDNVKIKVVVGGKQKTESCEKGEVDEPSCAEQHHYILSRFLISRMLTFVTIPAPVALRISLDFKKSLVDRNILILHQEEMESELFHLMSRYGYDQEQQNMFRVMTTFYRKRIPLIVFVMGTGCTGKSTVAALVGDALNNHNIINTDNVHCMMQAVQQLTASATAGGSSMVLPNLDTLLASHSPSCLMDRGAKPREEPDADWNAPLWSSSSGVPDVSARWKRRCDTVRRGLQADVDKAFSSGKVLIVEGADIDGAMLGATHQRCLDWVSTSGSPTRGGREKTSVGADRPSDKKAGTGAAISLGFLIKLKPQDEQVMRENWVQAHSRTTSCPSMAESLSRLRQVEECITSSVSQQQADGSSLPPGLVETVEFDCGNPSLCVDTIHRRVLQEIVLAVGRLGEE